MNSRLFIAWITAATIFGAAASSLGLPPTCDTTFRVEEGAWRNPANWNSGVPDSTKVACIDDNCTATLYYGICVGGENAGDSCDKGTGAYDCPDGTCDSSAEEAAAIVVEPADEENPGRLEVRQYGRLIITGVKNEEPVDSWVEEDEVFVYPHGVVMINNDLTITGDGTLQGYWDEGTCPLGHTYIDAVGTCDEESSNPGEYCAPWAFADELPERHQCPGGTCDPPATLPTLTIEDPQGESFELRGRWKICVPIQNDAAVVSDYKYRSLILTKDGNSGSGLWRVQTDAHWPATDKAAELYVEGTVTGSAKWEIAGGGTLILNDSVSGSRDWELTGSASTVTVNAACTSLSGDVEITSGTIEVNENFDTSGNLEMHGSSDGASLIEVASGKTAVFD